MSHEICYNAKLLMQLISVRVIRGHLHVTSNLGQRQATTSPSLGRKCAVDSSTLLARTQLVIETLFNLSRNLLETLCSGAKCSTVY